MQKKYTRYNTSSFLAVLYYRSLGETYKIFCKVDFLTLSFETGTREKTKGNR
jgi:hypothetical protein